MDVTEHELHERLIRHVRPLERATVPAAGAIAVRLAQVPAGHEWHVERVAVEAPGLSAAVARDGFGYVVDLELSAGASDAASFDFAHPLVLQPGEVLEVTVTATAGAIATVRAWAALVAPTPRPWPPAPLEVLVAGFAAPPAPPVEVTAPEPSARVGAETTGPGTPTA